jgi:hypothetical protein
MIAADLNHPAGTPRMPPFAALLLAATSAGMLVLLAHHPVTTAYDAHERLEQLAALGSAAATVHGLLICLVGALLYGVIALAMMLGPRRPGVAFGLAAFALGCAAVDGAMLLDGFVAADLARHILAAGQPDNGAVALALVSQGIQVLTKAGFCGMGLGMVCLSWARPRSTRLLAGLSVPAGLLPPLAVVGSSVRLGPHALVLVMVLQALWYAAAALDLWRGAQSTVSR